MFSLVRQIVHCRFPSSITTFTIFTSNNYTNGAQSVHCSLTPPLCPAPPPTVFSQRTPFTDPPPLCPPPSSFFPAEATSEILAELLPGLCPFDSNTTWVLECLEAFLPTDLPPELYEHGWKLWLPQLTALLQVMENGGAWDQVSGGGSLVGWVGLGLVQ